MARKKKQIDVNNQPIVNAATGEQLGTLREGDQVRFVRKKTLEFLKGTTKLDYDNFYIANSEELRQVMKTLSMGEKAFLSSVVLYMDFQSCCLVKDNGEPINIDDLPEITGMSERALTSITAGLMQKNIIRKNKDGRKTIIFINPWLYCKGNRFNSTLKAMFREYYIHGKQCQWKDLRG